MNPVERIKYMLKMEAQRPQKDDAGIYIAGGIEAGLVHQQEFQVQGSRYSDL